MTRLQNVSWDDLIAEFPPLWDPQDLCFGDRHVKNQCRQQLLEKANLLSSVPISMDGLRRRLRTVNKRLRNGRQETNDRTQTTPASRLSTSTSTNPETTQPIISIPCLRELTLEYPCLWNPQDVNYTNEHIRTTCEEQLLVKYNNLATSRTQITMSELQQKLQDLRPQPARSEPGRPTASQPEKRRQPRFTPLEKLAAEYPCLWDPKDPGYSARSVKRRCLRQLLDKYNSQSTYRINYSEMKTMIQSMIRRQRRAAAAPRLEDPRDDWNSDLGNSSDSTDQTNNQTPVMSIVFHCCTVCGEIKSESLNNTNKPYIENDKTTLAINNLSVELNFDKDATVCLNCDMKLKEMHDFVKFVNNAQDKMKGLINADVITLDDDNDDHKLIIDSLTVTDTEIVRPTVSNKRKAEETPELKKKCRVTIDLNTCDDESTMDDIAKYRMFKNDGIPMESNDADDVPKVTDTGHGEDINFSVKEEIEDEIHEDVDEFGEITDDDKSENIVSEHAHEKEADTLKEVESSKTVTQEEKRNDIDGNEVVSKETRNGIMDEHTSESEISAATSIVNALASKEPVCVMPKSELIGLVESIVSRMMNK